MSPIYTEDDREHGELQVEEKLVQCQKGAIGVIRSHSLKIAFNIKRLSVSRRDENRF